MNTIVILCGGGNSGKSTTLSGFYRLYTNKKLNGKIVCKTSVSSPQEQEKFCNVRKVQENINKRIQIANRESGGNPYLLLIPFTMKGKQEDRSKRNNDCILKPLEKLKETFSVIVVYLRKTNTQCLQAKDDLMVTLADVTIETTKEDYNKSLELERFLKKTISRD